MPPRGSKRPRSPSDPTASASADPTSLASASHLVSFLTGYADQDRAHDSPLHRSGSHSGSEDEDEDPDFARDNDYDEDEDEDPDDDDDEGGGGGAGTPRRRTGLVGSSTSTPSKSTPKRTPKKRGGSSTPTPTPTPRNRKAPLGIADEAGENEGIVRASRSDAYFVTAGRSAKTSGSSYAALVRPLSQAQYEQYANGARSRLASASTSSFPPNGNLNGKGKHPAVGLPPFPPPPSTVSSLVSSLSLSFPQWESELEEGFNLLLYGFGSKRRLVNDFTRTHLSSLGHCVIVNGHFPQLGIRDVLAQIEDCLAVPQDIPVPPSLATPLDRSAHRIYAYFLPSDSIKPSQRRSSPTSSAPLYLTIHNLDSPTLRTPRSLSILSLLASCPRIHLIATFDHVNTSLLFPSTLSNSPPHTYSPGEWSGTPPSSRGFNWIYHNATTYDDYDVELTYQRLSATSTLTALASASGGISEEGALQILRSVPPMALRLLKLLLTRQLSSLPPDTASHAAHPATPIAPVFAIDNDILQTLAREKFIAREEERFNALIGEFKDHGLVVQAELDGEGRTGRWVWVPLGKAAIERVLVEMKDTQI